MTCSTCIYGDLKYTFHEKPLKLYEDVSAACSSTGRSIAILDNPAIIEALSSSSCCRSYGEHYVLKNNGCSEFTPHSKKVVKPLYCNSARRYICQEPVPTTLTESKSSAVATTTKSRANPSLPVETSTDSNSLISNSNPLTTDPPPFPVVKVAGGLVAVLLLIFLIIGFVILRRQKKHWICFGFTSCMKRDDKSENREDLDVERRSTLQNHGYYSIRARDEQPRSPMFNAMHSFNLTTPEQLSRVQVTRLESHEYQEALPTYEEIPEDKPGHYENHDVTFETGKQNLDAAGSSAVYSTIVKCAGSTPPVVERTQSGVEPAPHGSGVEYTMIRKPPAESGVEYSTVTRCLNDESADVYAVVRKSKN